MTILGIDYGRKKMGFSLASGFLARPYGVEHASTFEEFVKVISDILDKERVEKIVVGVSEGKMGIEQVEFAKKLETVLGQKVITWDETLSTQDAQRLARKANISQKRRRELEDAFAASVMLQSYIDYHGSSKKGS